MIRILLLLFLTCAFSLQSIAKPPREGMWIPLLLEYFNIQEMQEMGLELDAEDIYSETAPSLKDAILIFGGGCTGSMISSRGLLLTNHHCGYGRIQKHSSIENDYLKDGFWAGSTEEELPNPGLTATFIVRIEDVTEEILSGTDTLSPANTEEITGERITELEARAVEGTHYDAEIKPFFNGNEYYLFVKETYRDIRLVGAPPSSIGKFGGDEDNWMWPRHTGDFSLFRIYAGPDNKPADYSPDNQPYKPKKHLEISLEGLEEDDFTMVFGFPGITFEYLPSYAVKHIMEVSDPHKIALRKIRLDVIDAAMAANDTIRIQYASKQSRISNAYKKWKGEVRGLHKAGALVKKQALEEEFTKWSLKNGNEKYRGIISEYSTIYDELGPYSLARDYLIEAGLGVELIAFANGFRQLEALSSIEEINQEEIAELIASLKNKTAGFFKDFRPEIDREIFPRLMTAYKENVPPRLLPDIFRELDTDSAGYYANNLYNATMFTSEAELLSFLEDYEAEDLDELLNEPLYQWVRSLLDNYFENVFPKYQSLNDRLEEIDRLYLEGLRKMDIERKFYPDANSTMRITYGQVKGYKPVDGTMHMPFTTAEGILEKAATAHPDYEAPSRLINLIREKNFGPYGTDGQLYVGFIATNHTTGGNSGSPVLNGKGELIGLNFDRNWEGTMSDYFYDPDQVRNISVDIRYILFVIDQFAGAEWIIEELED